MRPVNQMIEDIPKFMRLWYRTIIQDILLIISMNKLVTSGIQVTLVIYSKQVYFYNQLISF